MFLLIKVISKILQCKKMSWEGSSKLCLKIYISLPMLSTWFYFKRTYSEVARWLVLESKNLSCIPVTSKNHLWALSQSSTWALPWWPQLSHKKECIANYLQYLLKPLLEIKISYTYKTMLEECKSESLLLFWCSIGSIFLPWFHFIMINFKIHASST